MKNKESAAYKKIQGAELLALANNIKVLNDDDALDHFKKTLPVCSASLLQVEITAKAMAKSSSAALKHAEGKSALKRSSISLMSSIENETKKGGLRC